MKIAKYQHVYLRMSSTNIAQLELVAVIETHIMTKHAHVYGAEYLQDTYLFSHMLRLVSVPKPVKGTERHTFPAEKYLCSIKRRELHSSSEPPANSNNDDRTTPHEDQPIENLNKLLISLE